uniref:EGF-like domain-containing protein n=1 Tax=Panagrellus redivivus TaxID=6233 RepID=A0A7E4V3D6_PANRE
MKFEKHPQVIFALVAMYGCLVVFAEDVDTAPTEPSIPSLIFLPQRYNITCCRGGTPEIVDSMLAINLTMRMLDYVIEEDTPDMSASANCRHFTGKYFISPEHFLESGLPRRGLIKCHCPNVGASGKLDAHCRRLPECRNKGFREDSVSPCKCLNPFFGDTCEKLCDQGQLMKDINDRYYCSCNPFYQGEECKQIVCLHGGREQDGRCVCPPQFWGSHCEVDTNKTGTGNRFQRFGDGNEGFTRDISGTIFSLVMIVVLVVSMYLLMKHRMQTRYLHRRPDLLTACNFPVSPGGTQCLSRRVELRPPHDDPRIYPFRPIGTLDGGPPPYIPPGQRSRRNRHEVLPPLPSYEDATKMPALQPGSEDDIDTTTLPDAIATSSAIETVSSPVALMRQASIISNASSSLSTASAISSISGTSSVAAGRACSLELDSATRQAMIHPVVPLSAADAERHLSEQLSNNNRTADDGEDGSLKRDSSVRKSL